MQNFEQKLKQERATNTVESNNTIKTETLDTKKPESHEDLTKRLKTNLEQSKSLENKMQEDTEHLNKIRQALGLGHQTEDTVSMRANKEKLASLNKEYSEMHNTILEDDTYSIDNLEGVFEDKIHMGHKIATKGNLMWEKSSRDMQRSYEKSKAETNQKSRDLAARIHGGGMEMSDEEWGAKVAKEKSEDEAKFAEIKKGLDDFGNKTNENLGDEQKSTKESRKSFDELRKDSDKKAKETNDYFANGEYVKENSRTQEDINIQNEIDNLNDPDGSKRAKEKANKEYWDNYENTVMGMNEHIGYNPVSAEKYKAQLEKELGEKGASKEEIEEEWQKMKNNPHATWI